MDRKDIVCLANSAKLGAYCFAGIDISGGEWVRPIGSGPHGAVTSSEQRLDTGSMALLLDVVSVPLSRPMPIPGQPENWELEAAEWRFVRGVADHEAAVLLEQLTTTELLFGTSGKPVPVSDVAEGRITSSLAVVRPSTVLWRYEGPTKLYAEFEHCGTDLSLKVTDPVFIQRFRGQTPNTYGLRDDDSVTTYLTVSLPEEFKGAHWKLVAGVFRLPRTEVK